MEAAFDNDPILTSAHASNFPGTKLHLVDLATVSGSEVLASVGDDIDVVFGGPPCQGFSNIGLRDVNDPRRLLLGHFFRLVSEIQPAVFVMENVVGLVQGTAREVLDAAMERVCSRYKLVGPIRMDASDYGAATRRERVFVIGYDGDRCGPVNLSDIESARAPAGTVTDAINDLEGAEQHPETTRKFDIWSLSKSKNLSAYAKSLRSDDSLTTGLRLTAHAPHVVERFRKVAQGGLDRVGRHPRLAWSGQCPTLRAGTGPDKGSFQAVRPIHPLHPRVITVREAARLQGFSDSHRFHPTIWHSFRIIGNSVSPFVGGAIFRAVMSRCEASESLGKSAPGEAE